jgi:hypothetical protein
MMETFAPMIQLNMKTMSGFASLKRLIVEIDIGVTD